VTGAGRFVVGFPLVLSTAFAVGEVLGRLMFRWSRAATVPAAGDVVGPGVVLDWCQWCGPRCVPTAAVTVNPSAAFPGRGRSLTYTCPGCGWEIWPPVSDVVAEELLASGAVARPTLPPLKARDHG
jgi:hypothetical protein